MATIKEKFQTYERDVIPKTAGKEQRQETERAFYAGAIAVFGLVVSADDESELDAINNELETYIRAIINKSKGKQ